MTMKIHCAYYFVHNVQSYAIQYNNAAMRAMLKVYVEVFKYDISLMEIKRVVIR